MVVIKWVMRLISWGGDAQFTWKFIVPRLIAISPLPALLSLFSLPLAAVVLVGSLATLLTVAAIGSKTGRFKALRVLGHGFSHDTNHERETVHLELTNRFWWRETGIRIKPVAVELWSEQQGWVRVEDFKDARGSIVELNPREHVYVALVTRNHGAGAAEVEGTGYSLFSKYSYRLWTSISSPNYASQEVPLCVTCDWGAEGHKVHLLDCSSLRPSQI